MVDPQIFESKTGFSAQLKPVELSQQEKTQEQIIKTLAELGNLTVANDDLSFSGNKFVLPEQFRGNISAAIRYLHEVEVAEETKYSFNKEFPYRWQDGAAAFDRAMKFLFGSSGLGGTIQNFFSKTPPTFVTIPVGPKETLQVPWGRVLFPPLDAQFDLGIAESKEYGKIFTLNVLAPRKYRAPIEAFFKIVEFELKERSIFRGKAFYGGEEPIFKDVLGFDTSSIVYSESVLSDLNTHMWSLLKYTDEMRKNNLPLKRAILVEGPFGSGKTSAGTITGKIAVENGWTFVIARPGEERLGDILKTARLYAPSVVWFEDIDVAQGKSDLEVSALLDMLDGVTTKGSEVLAGFTTNHVEQIQKPVLRPGRLDAIIHIGSLDGPGYEKIIKLRVPAGKLNPNIDFPSVTTVYEELKMLPAFVSEAIDRAMRSSMARNNGKLLEINAIDLIDAAKSLTYQLNLMNDATVGVEKNKLEDTFASIVSGVLSDTGVFDSYGDKVYSLNNEEK